MGTDTRLRFPGLAMTSQRDAGERLVVHRRMHSGS
jgi:hypothetical protein